jgi:hypothetical protein
MNELIKSVIALSLEEFVRLSATISWDQVAKLLSNKNLLVSFMMKWFSALDFQAQKSEFSVSALKVCAIWSK